MHDGIWAAVFCIGLDSNTDRNTGTSHACNSVKDAIMIPDLGIYAVEVTSAYVLSISLLITILVLSLLRARKIRAQLLKVEASRLLNNV